VGGLEKSGEKVGISSERVEKEGLEGWKIDVRQLPKRVEKVAKLWLREKVAKQGRDECFFWHSFFVFLLLFMV
jgi:hypothetical protein